jgi:hypothetical protein
MKLLQIASVLCLTATRLAADDFLDQVDDALTVGAFHENLRVRVSGLLDLEAFFVDQPPPGLIDSDEHFLLNPRLTLFLDAQLGSQFYFFVQSRLDRGFDPSDNGAQIRLDEYALRLTPWDDSRFVFEIGKFATVIGNWVRRHQSWENPFITAPLPYENLTAVSDVLVPYSPQYFLRGFVPGERYEHNPIIWGPNYTTGFAAMGKLNKFDYALEIKNSAPASRPSAWGTDTGFDHPAVNGRVGWQPNEIWNLGVSAGSAPYLRSETAPLLPAGKNLGDYRELLLGQDVSFAWHHVQLWAELYQVRFEVPRVGNADTFAFYIEGKYKFTPELFAALRWNQQLFQTVPDGEGGSAKWGRDLWRLDSALAYRFSAHTQLKLQYSIQNQPFGPPDVSHNFAAQVTVRF